VTEFGVAKVDDIPDGAVQSVQELTASDRPSHVTDSGSRSQQRTRSHLRRTARGDIDTDLVHDQAATTALRSSLTAEANRSLPAIANPRRGSQIVDGGVRVAV